MKKTLSIALLLACCHILVAQSNKLPAFVSDKLDGYIKDNLKKWRIPGLAVAIVKDGKTVFMKGYGVRKTGGKQKVDENTLFMIGSNTKAFTGTSIAILHTQKKLQIRDKVQKWLPEFKLKDPLASKEANIADLLSHRIGFATFQGDFVYWGSKLSRAGVIKKMSLIKAPYSFRSRWGYCNAAFVAAGELAAKVTGKTWEDNIRQQILKPLGMSRTIMLCQEFKNAQNTATPHTIINDKVTTMPVANIDNLAPAGSMSSSVKDMAKWLNVQVYEGEINGKKIIPGRALRITRIPQSMLGTDQRAKQPTHFYLYGMGLSINDRKGKLVYSHTGGVNGFLSSVVFVPEEKLGIVVLTNSDQNNFFENLSDEIRDAFLGVPSKNYNETSLKEFIAKKKKEASLIQSLKDIVKKKNKPDLPLKAFTGIYKNTVYGTINIKLKKGKLNIYFSNHPNLVGKLEHTQDNKFLCTYSDPIMGIRQLPFKIAQGKVVNLTLSVSDFVENTSYSFVKQ